MGLKRKGTNKTFITIVGGEFCIRVPEGTEGARERKLTAGKNEGTMISELTYSEVSGMITDLKYSEKEFGSFIEITIKDDKEYMIQIPWNSFGIRDSFLKRLPFVDEKKETVFTVFPDKETGRSVFLVSQDDDFIKCKFTKDEPNGLPQPIEKQVRGRITWDFSECENFLYNVLQENLPRFEAERVKDYQEEMPEDICDEVGIPDDNNGIVGQDEPPF